MSTESKGIVASQETASEDLSKGQPGKVDEQKKSKNRGLYVLTGLGGAAVGAAIAGLVASTDKDEINSGIDDFQIAWLGQQPPQLPELSDTRGYDLLFDTDKAVIGASQTPVVIDILADLSADPARTALVVGCADRSGNDVHNKTLAKDRADIITSALVAAGVDQSRINTTSFGEECRLVGPDNLRDQGKRRVEVLVRDLT